MKNFNSNFRAIFFILCLFTFSIFGQSNINLEKVSSTSENIFMIGNCNVTGSPIMSDAIAIHGLTAYLTTSEKGISIISLLNPFRPREIDFFEINESVWSIKTRGNKLFVTCDHGLKIFEIQKRGKLKFLGSFNVEGFCEGFDIHQNYLYLTDAPNHLRILDIKNPKNPIELGFFDNLVFPTDVEVQGNFAYVADENCIQVIDVSTPNNPSFVMKYDVFALNLEIKANYLYIADYHDYIFVFDIYDPYDIKLIDQYQTPGYPAGVSVSSRFANIADMGGGLRVLNVSNPYSLEEVGIYMPDEEIVQSVNSLGRVIFIGAKDKFYILFNASRPFPLFKEMNELEQLITEQQFDITTIEKFSLNQNYPNPFNPVTTIKYSIPEVGKSEKLALSSAEVAEGRNVILKVYDVLGREIATLVNQKQNPGNYEVTWDGLSASGGHAPSGVYFYKLDAGDYTNTKKMLMIK